MAEPVFKMGLLPLQGGIESLEFRLVGEKLEAAGLIKRRIEPGDCLQHGCKSGPGGYGIPRPFGIGHKIGSLALQPDEAEISLRGAEVTVGTVTRRPACKRPSATDRPTTPPPMMVISDFPVLELVEARLAMVLGH